MAKKPSLADMANKKPTAAAMVEDAAEKAEAAAGRQKRAGAQPDGKKGILVRVEVAGWRALRDLAAELTEASGEQHSMQSLLTEQINKLLVEHGRPPVA